MATHSGPPSVFPLSDRTFHLSQILSGLVIFFLLLSSTLFGVYLYSRIRPVLRLELDDWIATAAYVLTTTDTSVGFATAALSLSKKSRFLAMGELSGIGKRALANAFVGAWAMAAIKISVACLFLRLKRSAGKPWQRFLFAMIAIQIVTATFTTVMQATRFGPIDARWSIDRAFRERSRVWCDRSFSIGIGIASFINVVTDITFSVLPVILLWDIQVPLREKIVVVSLMGLGLVASAASIVKAIKIQGFGKADVMAAGVEFGIWTLLEEQLGLIAACVPRLKVQVQQFLVQRGWISSTDSTPNCSGPHNYAVRKHGKRRSGVRDPYSAPFYGLSGHSIELTAGGGGESRRSMTRTSIDENMISRRV